jgi:hypothetical protein
MLTYTLLRRDHRAPDYGYVVSQHYTLRRGIACLLRHDGTTHVLAHTQGYIAKGSTVAIRAGDVVQFKRPTPSNPLEEGCICGHVQQDHPGIFQSCMACSSCDRYSSC